MCRRVDGNCTGVPAWWEIPKPEDASEKICASCGLQFVQTFQKRVGLYLRLLYQDYSLFNKGGSCCMQVDRSLKGSLEILDVTGC